MNKSGVCCAFAAGTRLFLYTFFGEREGIYMWVRRLEVYAGRDLNDAVA